MLAVRFSLPGPCLPGVDLACRLLAGNLETPATTEVACLSYGTPLRDAEPVLRQMLIEHGIAVSGPGTGDADQFRAALRAFGSRAIDMGEFSAVSYRLLPAWNEQDTTQHESSSAFETRHSRRAMRPNVLAGQRARRRVPAISKPDRNLSITAGCRGREPAGPATGRPRRRPAVRSPNICGW